MASQILKKFFLVSSVVLLAVGCNSASKPAENTSQNNQVSQAQNQGTIANANANASGEKVYTMADVQDASAPEKCWTAINGQVYDLTAWINKHPGGDKNILKLCGKDGSTLFNGKHGGQAKPEETLKGFSIGSLK